MWYIVAEYNLDDVEVHDLDTDKFIPAVDVHSCEPFDREWCIYKFRLLDDNNVVYFEGYCDTNDDEEAFEPLDDFGDAFGCTKIEYYDPEKNIWEIL